MSGHRISNHSTSIGTGLFRLVFRARAHATGTGTGRGTSMSHDAKHTRQAGEGRLPGKHHSGVRGRHRRNAGHGHNRCGCGAGLHPRRLGGRVGAGCGARPASQTQVWYRYRRVRAGLHPWRLQDVWGCEARAGRYREMEHHFPEQKVALGSWKQAESPAQDISVMSSGGTWNLECSAHRQACRAGRHLAPDTSVLGAADTHQGQEELLRGAQGTRHGGPGRHTGPATPAPGHPAGKGAPWCASLPEGFPSSESRSHFPCSKLCLTQHRVTPAP